MATETLTSEEVRGAHRAAWLLMIAGLLSIAVGVIVLLKPADSLETLVVITGIFVLLDGALDLFGSFSRSTENRGLAAVLGVVSIVVGVLLIRHPIGGVLAAALLIGIWLIAAGTVRAVRGFDRPHRGWNIVVGVVEVAAGVVLVSSPSISYATLALLVGIAFLVNGVSQLALGWVVHSVQRDLQSPAFSAGAPA